MNSKFFSTLAIRALVVAFVIVIFCGLLAVFEPILFRLYIFQPVREARLFVKELGLPKDFSKVEIIDSFASKEIVLPQQPGQLNIAADVWVAPQPNGQGILLLHGSSPWGRKAGLIQMLGGRLAQHGYTVLAPDARGIGDTEDPLDPNNPNAWDVSSDVTRHLEYLEELVEPSSELIAIGHSLGANHVMEGALNDPRVKKIVLIGPSRFLKHPDQGMSKWERVRYAADRRLDDPIPEKVGLHRRLVSDIVWHESEGHFYQGNFSPILLVDGSKESLDERNLLKSVSNRIGSRVTYLTLQDTGHYIGVLNLFGGDSLFYREDLFDSFFQTLTRFLEK